MLQREALLTALSQRILASPNSLVHVLHLVCDLLTDPNAARTMAASDMNAARVLETVEAVKGHRDALPCLKLLAVLLRVEPPDSTAALAFIPKAARMLQVLLLWSRSDLACALPSCYTVWSRAELVCALPSCFTWPVLLWPHVELPYAPVAHIEVNVVFGLPRSARLCCGLALRLDVVFGLYAIAGGI